MISAAFGRAAIEALPAGERRQRLATLESYLTQQLADFEDWSSYWGGVADIIAELKALGHDLWRHDFDGESRELWGWDYTTGKTGTGQLQLQFHFGGRTRAFWRTENPLLGVDDDF